MYYCYILLLWTRTCVCIILNYTFRLYYFSHKNNVHVYEHMYIRVVQLYTFGKHNSYVEHLLVSRLSCVSIQPISLALLVTDFKKSFNSAFIDNVSFMCALETLNISP